MRLPGCQPGPALWAPPPTWLTALALLISMPCVKCMMPVCGLCAGDLTHAASLGRLGLTTREDSGTTLFVLFRPEDSVGWAHGAGSQLFSQLQPDWDAPEMGGQPSVCCWQGPQCTGWAAQTQPDRTEEALSLGSLSPGFRRC